MRMESRECAKNLADPANIKMGCSQYTIRYLSGKNAALKKARKKVKKVLTKGGGFGILTKLSGTADAEPKGNEKST